MENLVPRKIFFTNEVGKDKDELHSFERVLRDAGIEKFNLITVSSISPLDAR
ncbi:MAG: pyruvoyl-dependent arginine decarboxylase [Syntrophales bacterium]